MIKSKKIRTEKAKILNTSLTINNATTDPGYQELGCPWCQLTLIDARNGRPWCFSSTGTWMDRLLHAILIEKLTLGRKKKKKKMIKNMKQTMGEGRSGDVILTCGHCRRLRWGPPGIVWIERTAIRGIEACATLIRIKATRWEQRSWVGAVRVLRSSFRRLSGGWVIPIACLLKLLNDSLPLFLELVVLGQQLSIVFCRGGLWNPWIRLWKGWPSFRPAFLDSGCCFMSCFIGSTGKTRYCLCICLCLCLCLCFW